MNKDNMLINECYAVVYFSNGGHMLAHYALLSGSPVSFRKMELLIIERTASPICKVDIITKSHQAGNFTIPNIII